MEPRIIAIAGPLEGAAWPLDRELTVGRDKANAIFIDDLSISRRHCAFVVEGGRCMVRDFGSSNGSFVNGQPVTERSLEHGDQVRIGRSIFRFSSREEPAALRPGSKVGATQVLKLEDSRLLRPDLLHAAAQSERLRQQMDALLGFVSSLAGSSGLDGLSGRIADVLAGSLPSASAAVLCPSGEPGEYEFLARTAAGFEIAPEVVEQAIAEGAGVLAGGDALAMPVRGGSGVVAVVCLDARNAAERLDEDHLQFAAAVAGVSALPLENALRIRSLEAENRRLLDEIHIEHDMVGESGRMREVFTFVSKAAPTQSTVLIRGESGTGKELVARAIHRNSPRARGPFVAINCAALTETLLESELFGHEKGAFTGAVTQKRGRIEDASGGTLFLDEIGEMAAGLQAKLLRVLQERQFERVGGNQAVKVDVRLIAATHRDLESMVKTGGFRQDLYYRLNVVAVSMPALRERREDIGVLAEHFIQKHGRGIGRPVRGISPEARAKLRNYDWPGNVRELENAIERALVLGTDPYIQPDDLPESIAETGGAPVAGSATGDYHAQVIEAKRQIVARALEANGNDYNAAARALGLHPSNLYRLVRQFRNSDSQE